jgi:hypothetical protein
MRDFKTSDLQLASFLVTLGHPVVAVEGQRDRRHFVFRDVPEADVTAYYGGARQVRPRDLFVAYRDLKALLFQLA